MWEWVMNKGERMKRIKDREEQEEIKDAME